MHRITRDYIVVGQRSSRRGRSHVVDERRNEVATRWREENSWIAIRFRGYCSRPGSQYTYTLLSMYTCKRVPTNSFRSHARSTKYARSNLDESQNSKKQQHAYMTVYIYNVYMCIQSGVSIQYRVNLKNKILKKISRIKGF